MTKLIHMTLLKVKISGEVPWKLCLPLVLILKKVFWGLCFWYSCCVALGPAILDDKKLSFRLLALSEFDQMYVLLVWLWTTIFISFNSIAIFIFTFIVIFMTIINFLWLLWLLSFLLLLTLLYHYYYYFYYHCC